MKTKKIITGDVFIIPNGVLTPEDVSFADTYHSLYITAIKNDVKFDNNTRFVQVWFCTPGNSDSNWVDHYIDGYKELKGWRPISSYLPVDIFANKKEGDVVTIDLPIVGRKPKNPIRGIDITPAGCRIPAGVSVETTIKVSLTLAQGKYRYRKFGDGKFENLIK